MIRNDEPCRIHRIDWLAGSAAAAARGPETEKDESLRVGLACLPVLAFIVGIVTGFGAVGFRALIGLNHNVMFLGHVAVNYNANLFTPTSPWGAFIIG